MMHRAMTFCCLLAIASLMAATGVGAEPAKGNEATGRRGVKQEQQANDPRKRVALVIGNNRYARSPLKSPVNDAHVVAATLRRLGFEVEEKSNLGHVALRKTVAAFGKRMKGGEVGLFYFAGHGIQVQGKNYLLPVDAKAGSGNDVPKKALAAEMVLDVMEEAGNAVNIFVLDACRDNPFGRSFRSASPGLASMAAPINTIISFAAAPGGTATDRTGRTGVYAESLIQVLDTPGLELEDIFMQVSAQVQAGTAGAQVPWKSSSLKAGFQLVPPFDPSGTPPQNAGAVAAIDSAAPPLQGFYDSITGMEFVPVPGGCFRMGDLYGDGYNWEKPVHVACVNDFAIGKYEVTQGQWKRVMGNNPANFTNCGDDCPMEQVSWDDAQEFIRELNRLTSRKYRLPTEAEWEYAARSGGKNEKFSGGNNVDALAWYTMNSAGMTQRVGTKQANGLGVHDMSGNVWEWVQDWYGSYSSGRQENPTGPSAGNFRVFRGGGWSQGAGNARTSIRYYNAPGTRLDFLGLRLASPLLR